MSRYRLIEAEKATFPIVVMCRVLDVVRSGSDAWRQRATSERTRADAALRERIVTIHAASRGVYGAPRIHGVLRAEGMPIGRKRIARLMRIAQVAGIRRGRRSRIPAIRWRRTWWIGGLGPRPPNRLWVADLTSIPTDAGWLHLAIVLDVHSRRVIGWAMDERMPVDLPLAALRMALRRRPATGAIHHRDRGSQDTAAVAGRSSRPAACWPR